MSFQICKHCWANPCICGDQFKDSTTDHILLLMEGLTMILQQRDIAIDVKVDGKDIKEHLLTKNRGLTYVNGSTLLSILEEQKFHIPKVYKDYINSKSLASEVYFDLKSPLSIPHRTAFAVTLYTTSLVYTDNSLQYFFYTLLRDYTCLFDNPKMKELIRYTDTHVEFCKNLYTATHQIYIIIQEKLKQQIDLEWLIAWGILTRIDSFYKGDLNLKFQAMKEIIELISGGNNVTIDDIFMKPKDMVEIIDHLTRRDYEWCEIDDDDTLRYLFNKENIKQPYFGTLQAH